MNQSTNKVKLIFLVNGFKRFNSQSKLKSQPLILLICFSKSQLLSIKLWNSTYMLKLTKENLILALSYSELYRDLENIYSDLRLQYSIIFLAQQAKKKKTFKTP